MEVDKEFLIDIAASYLRCAYAADRPHEDPNMRPYLTGKMYAYFFVLNQLAVAVIVPAAGKSTIENMHWIRGTWSVDGSGPARFGVDKDLVQNALRRIRGEDAQLEKDIIAAIL